LSRYTNYFYSYITKLSVTLNLINLTVGSQLKKFKNFKDLIEYRNLLETQL